MLIKIEHLRKEFENVTPLKDINCEIAKGEVISIIGPSGCGKSTFINCINRLETPTSGKIIFDGIDITDKNCDIYDIRKRIGMVFQSFNLFSHLTIIENAMLAPIEILHADRDKLYKECIELLDSVGLKDKANAYPDELSGGQQQRAAIVRTIAMKPEVILFDEPTSALDPAIVRDVESDIKRLSEQKYTMLIVTHDMRFAKNIADRVFYMDEGLIYEEGTPSEIFDNPKKEKTKEFMKMVMNKEVKL